MQEITKKLHKKVMEDFRPIAESLAMEGRSSGEIVDVFKKQLNLKAKQYYDKNHRLSSMSDIFSNGNIIDFCCKQSADSRAEKIFFEMLTDKNIEFKFQFPVGPYKADFLFAGYLVVELDGPQHDKDHDERRDKYMRGMGYKIIRVPIWILMSCPESVIEEIKEVIEVLSSRRRTRKGGK